MRRWELPVTTVVAAGGFGKTTLLRQAVAENRAAERGVDVVVGCRPFDREADALAGRILAALDAPPTAEQEDDPVVLAGAVVGALAAQSPRPVCLALDDVHELGEDTSATELVRVLVRTLPGNGHLLLSGRRLPATLPRARLRAADAVAEVGEDELSFDDDELVGLADHHGLAPDDLAELGRWPALVRLSITVGRRESMEFLRQEVLDDLAPDVRRALGVAVLAGAADDALLVDLGGLGAADLAAAAPLVDLDGSGAAVPHALWREVVDQLVDEGTTRDLVGAIADRLVGAGSYDEALDLLAGAGAADGAAAVVLAALRGGDVLVGRAQAVRWLRHFPPEERAGPRSWSCGAWCRASPTSASVTPRRAMPPTSGPRPSLPRASTPTVRPCSARPRRASPAPGAPTDGPWPSWPSCGGHGTRPTAPPWPPCTASCWRWTPRPRGPPVPTRRSSGPWSPPSPATWPAPSRCSTRSGAWSSTGPPAFVELQRSGLAILQGDGELALAADAAAREAASDRADSEVGGHHLVMSWLTGDPGPSLRAFEVAAPVPVRAPQNRFRGIVYINAFAPSFGPAEPVDVAMLRQQGTGSARYAVFIAMAAAASMAARGEEAGAADVVREAVAAHGTDDAMVAGSCAASSPTPTSWCPSCGRGWTRPTSAPATAGSGPWPGSSSPCAKTVPRSGTGRWWSRPRPWPAAPALVGRPGRGRPRRWPGRRPGAGDLPARRHR